jgi:protein-L-isoaspartate O-methyltransferase
MSAHTASELHDHLRLLQQERMLALGTALGDDAAYMADLDEEILATRHAYVASAVIELAHLRAGLHGAMQG